MNLKLKELISSPVTIRDRYRIFLTTFEAPQLFLQPIEMRRWWMKPEMKLKGEMREIEH